MRAVKGSLGHSKKKMERIVMCLCNARDRRDRQEMRDMISLFGSFGLSGFFGPTPEIIETNQTDQTNEIDHPVPPVSHVSRHGPWPLSYDREGQGQATTPLRPASLALRVLEV